MLCSIDVQSAIENHSLQKNIKQFCEWYWSCIILQKVNKSALGQIQFQPSGISFIYSILTLVPPQVTESIVIFSSEWMLLWEKLDIVFRLVKLLRDLSQHYANFLFTQPEVRSIWNRSETIQFFLYFCDWYQSNLIVSLNLRIINRKKRIR